MTTRVGGFRRKTRSKLKKNIRNKGKISISSYFKRYKIGEKVNLLGEPAIQKGFFFPRFKGKIGVIKGKQGACYKVEIKDGKKAKILIVHPVHIRSV
ncbi:MAG: 50S ribosomal protein L21e [Nanoarchaeota archaeon]|nr:50S ribosomal protein L21e [Nanoarchaeota archaeon]